MLFKKLILLASVCGLCGCEYLRNHTAQDIFSLKFDDQKVEAQTVAASTSLKDSKRQVVVCRSHQCAPANLSMSKEYIYNSLLQLFDNNNYQKMLVCEADSQSHICLENNITLPLRVGAVPTNMYIDSIKITDVISGNQNNALNLILNYDITYGGQTAECSPAKSLLFARQINHVIMEDSGYNCKMTTIGMSNVKTVFAIDYIDLDYGYIGGLYSIGVSGPAFGGGSGYMLLRLPKNAHPLSPALKAPQSFSKAGSQAKTAGANTSGTVEVFPLSKSDN